MTRLIKIVYNNFISIFIQNHVFNFKFSDVKVFFNLKTNLGEKINPGFGLGWHDRSDGPTA
jgi:hypothetical protein